MHEMMNMEMENRLLVDRYYGVRERKSRWGVKEVILGIFVI